MKKRMAAAAMAAIMAWGSAQGAVQVSNVTASQRAGTKLLDITYDVSSDAASVVTVSVNIAHGAENIVATNLIGDIGPGVAIGTGKHIVWNAGTDWNGQFARELRVGVVADDGSPTPIPPTTEGMALVPAGTNTSSSPDWGPYSVTNGAPLYADKNEVTKTLWDGAAVWAETHGYTNYFAINTDTNTVSADGPYHPVRMVEWYRAIAWCNARSEKEGLWPCCYGVLENVYRFFYRCHCGSRFPKKVQWMCFLQMATTAGCETWRSTIIA